MASTTIIVSSKQAIQWPKWTDTFDLATQESYVDLTARILCGLYDGTCEHCRCTDPGRSWYANSARYILPSVWPNGPLEMIGMFNQYAEQERMADKDKVRDPVSSAFSKLQEHAAFWTFVKAVIRERLDEVSAQQPPTPAEHEDVGVVFERQFTAHLGPDSDTGAVSGPAQEPTTQETQTMNSEIVDPFGAKDTSGVISYGGEIDPNATEPKSNTGVYVVVSLGVLLVGGLIGLEFYRASKGIRPVYMARPMMPMYY